MAIYERKSVRKGSDRRVTHYSNIVWLFRYNGQHNLQQVNVNCADGDIVINTDGTFNDGKPVIVVSPNEDGSAIIEYPDDFMVIDEYHKKIINQGIFNDLEIPDNLRIARSPYRSHATFTWTKGDVTFIVNKEIENANIISIMLAINNVCVGFDGNDVDICRYNEAYSHIGHPVNIAKITRDYFVDGEVVSRRYIIITSNGLHKEYNQMIISAADNLNGFSLFYDRKQTKTILGNNFSKIFELHANKLYFKRFGYVTPVAVKNVDELYLRFVEDNNKFMSELVSVMKKDTNSITIIGNNTKEVKITIINGNVTIERSGDDDSNS